ncbi:P-loop containing nucleoside triphosphate hydrolase protein, partial [Piptocephalis cylindrospora]
NEQDWMDESREMSKQIQANNRKKKKSGGFQSFGLDHAILNAILKKGFKVPTPIQRKCIPLIMEGVDVVGMTRTGSGKTAAFVVPMLHRLKAHSAKVGARAIILSPGRELALQTLKVVKELGRFTDLRCCSLVGGDSLDDQFQMIASNPDILIATPGRLLHLLVEMEMELSMVEYIVFDEADRLFEMGFSLQLHEILHKLPPSRQTLLFSATLPKLLVDFAKAGLQDPTLVRLDVDTKISQDLEMAFFNIKPSEREGALLYLLQAVIKAPLRPSAFREDAVERVDYSAHQTIIFVSTKHHVEYITHLLKAYGYDVSYIYGALDMGARKQQIDAFRNAQTGILVVTDVAARGIDIPILENVINYDFVDTSKVFVHRVGRAARAGRRGWAYSLVSNEELPYLVDLQLFLDRPLRLSRLSTDSGKGSSQPDYTRELSLGTLPRQLMELEVEWVQGKLQENVDITALRQVSVNGMKLYRKTKPSAAPESYTRSKELIDDPVFGGVHPLLRPLMSEEPQEAVNLLASISNFRPSETIFEIGNRSSTRAKSVASQVMKQRRATTGKVIEATKRKRELKEKEVGRGTEMDLNRFGSEDEADEDDLKSVFKTPKLSAGESAKKDMRTSKRDEQFYMSHFQKDANTEKGYSMDRGGGMGGSKNGGSFVEQAAAATLDLTGDDKDTLRQTQNKLRWDAKKKKFIRGTGIGADNKKLIKTESGAKISASFKSGRFNDWKNKTKVQLPRVGEQELPSSRMMGINRRFKHNKVTEAKALDPMAVNYERKARHAKMREGQEGPGGAGRGGGGRVQSELKNSSQIRKDREAKQKRVAKTGRHGRGGGKKR